MSWLRQSSCVCSKQASALHFKCQKAAKYLNWNWKRSRSLHLVPTCAIAACLPASRGTEKWRSGEWSRSNSSSLVIMSGVDYALCRTKTAPQRQLLSALIKCAKRISPLLHVYRYKCYISWVCPRLHPRLEHNYILSHSGWQMPGTIFGFASNNFLQCCTQWIISECMQVSPFRSLALTLILCPLCGCIKYAFSIPFTRSNLNAIWVREWVILVRVSVCTALLSLAKQLKADLQFSRSSIYAKCEGEREREKKRG